MLARDCTGGTEANLKRQGFEAFCPRFRKTRRHARRIDQVLAPVFPGYIFVHFDRERNQWRAVNGTHGVGQVSQTPWLNMLSRSTCHFIKTETASTSQLNCV